MLPAVRDHLRAAYHYCFPKHAYGRLTSERWREEEIELALLPALVDPLRDAADIGANVGHYTLALSGYARHVHAFEPHPRLAHVLRHAMPRNVTVHNKAVSSQAGQACLTVPCYVRPVEGMASLTPRANAIFGDARRLMTIRVQGTTLDAYANHNIGFVKIDVEGHELEVLAGSKELIARQRPVVLLEVEDRHRAGAVEEAFNYFRERGYIGLFAHGGTLSSIERFSPALQNLTLISPGAARRSYAYVNNFIFMPGPQWSEPLQKKLSDLLHAASKAEECLGAGQVPGRP